MPDPYLVSHVVLWALVVILSIAVFALYQHFGQMYLNSEAGREGQGPELDVPFPRALAADLGGETLELPGGAPALVTFMEVDCRLCRELRDGLVEFATGRTDTTVIAVVAGPAADVGDFARNLDGGIRVIADERGRLTTKYGVGVFPFAVAVDSNGIVRQKAIVNTGLGLESLLRGKSDDTAPAEGVMSA